MTPYSRGRSKLPKTEMIRNMVAISKETYITSEISYKKIPANLKKKLEGLDIKRISNSIGQIEVILSKLDTVILKGEAKLLSL